MHKIVLLFIVLFGFAQAGSSLPTADAVVSGFQKAKLEIIVDVRRDHKPQANVTQYHTWVVFSAKVNGKIQSIGEIYEFFTLQDLADSQRLYGSDAMRISTSHKNIVLLVNRSVPAALAAKYQASLKEL